MMPAYLKTAKPRSSGLPTISPSLESGALKYNMRVCLTTRDSHSNIVTVTCYCMDTGITLEQDINFNKFQISKGLLKLFKEEIYRRAKALGMKCGQAKKATGGKHGPLTNYELRSFYAKLGGVDE